MSPRSLHKGSKKNRQRLVPRHPSGIANESAPFWRGVRCEQVVSARVIGYNEEKEQRALKRRSRRAAGSGGGPTGSSTRKPRSPFAEIRRLERALARRKTLAAQQRVAQQIAVLKRQLEEQAENARWHKASKEARKQGLLRA